MNNILKIPNQIINGNLVGLDLSKVDSIVLHHSAHTSANVKDIESWHINQGWIAIGYNYIVQKNGDIYEGRGFNLSAGVAGHNSHTINICFCGDYHNTDTDMSDKQFNAGIDIIKYVMLKLPRKVELKCHRDYGGSVCPGKYFPIDEMKTLTKRGDDLTMAGYEELNKEIKKLNDKLDAITQPVYDWTEACPKWSIPYVQKALDLGYIQGDEQGFLGLTDDRIWSLVVMLRMNGIMK